MLKCSICGKEFTTEYYAGGYIDHCINFSDSHKKAVYKYRGKVGYLEEICLHGNDLRADYDIKERLKCFMLWKEPDDEIKEYVSQKIEELIQTRDKAYGRAAEILDGLTSIEKLMLKTQLGRVDGSSVLNDLIGEEEIAKTNERIIEMWKNRKQ